jgi:hypothetical protein
MWNGGVRNHFKDVSERGGGKIAFIYLCFQSHLTYVSPEGHVDNIRARKINSNSTS